MSASSSTPVISIGSPVTATTTPSAPSSPRSPPPCSATTASLFYYIQAATALILILAANTAYNGFPLLSSILAQDRYLPRQLHTRGDRLAYSNGIILLARDCRRIDLRVRGFDDPVDPAVYPRCLHVLHAVSDRHGGALESGVGRNATPAATAYGSTARGPSTRSARVSPALVLVVVMVTKFTHGAYLVVIADSGALRTHAGHSPAL